MRPGWQWLKGVWGKRAQKIAFAYYAVFDRANPHARSVLADLAFYCRFGKSSFVAGDPYQTAFNEGARDAYLHLLEMAGLPAEEITTIMEEQDGIE